MTSPNASDHTRVGLRATVGKEGELVWGVVSFVTDDNAWLPQSYYAHAHSPEEVSAFYDDMTHAVRQAAKDICEAVYDLAAFQPSLFS